MSDNDKPMPGGMCWLEIPITSHSRAMKFYNTVFGWECETDGVPSPIAEIKEVFMFKRGPFTQGAFVVMDEANISRVVSDENTDKRKLGVLVTLYVDDGINSALERIEKAGGKTCVGRTEIGSNMGFFARFTDTEGNLLGIYSQS